MRRLAIIGTVGALAFTSCNSVCERTNNRINNSARGSDVMAEPGAKLKEKPVEPEKKQSVLAGAHIEKFKPSTFKFDRMYTLYEDGKGNAQIRRGTEIIEEGQIGKDRSKDGFTLYSKDGSVLSVHKSGFITVNYGPGELDRPVSR